MPYFTATPVPPVFGDIDAFQAEEEAFYQATGWDFLGMLSAMGRGEVHPSPAVQEWARYLAHWDAWTFTECPTDEYLALEVLEDGADTPASLRSRGHRRPQAARSARSRRSTFLGRLTYR